MMDAVKQCHCPISDVVCGTILLLFLLVGTESFFHDPHPVRSGRRFKTAWMRVFGGFSLKERKRKTV